MVYSARLATRVRRMLAESDGADEIKMFGGICFTLRGHMCCGVVGEDLVLRVGPKAYEDTLRRPHARPMDFTGRPLRGMVYVGPEGCRTQPALRAWVERAVGFVSSLPARRAKRKARAS